MVMVMVIIRRWRRQRQALRRWKKACSRCVLVWVPLLWWVVVSSWWRHLLHLQYCRWRWWPTHSSRPMYKEITVATMETITLIVSPRPGLLLVKQHLRMQLLIHMIPAVVQDLLHTVAQRPTGRHILCMFLAVATKISKDNTQYHPFIGVWGWQHQLVGYDYDYDYDYERYYTTNLKDKYEREK